MLTQLIVGGEPAALNEFPHMAAIGWRLPGGKVSWDCGGSLISEKFVISAAHCSNSENGKPVVVRMGDNELTSDFYDANNYKIKNIFDHPRYQNGLSYHDITLFELDRNMR